jgi:hypothetical protein
MVLMDASANSNRNLLKLVVALTPMAGTILFPLVVPILMLRVSIASGVIAAVVIGTLWFAAMLRTSEMPGHH